VDGRRPRAFATLVGGLLGSAVAVGLGRAAVDGLRAAGADETVLALLLVTLGTGVGYGCVRAGVALVRVIALHGRARSLLRAGRWEEPSRSAGSWWGSRSGRWGSTVR
jgi:hypothetical protein